jgi:tetratricopeptide (TPR) repeat protein
VSFRGVLGSVRARRKPFCTSAAIEARLLASLVSDERAAGKLVAADALRAQGKARDAVAEYQEALRMRESWLGRLGLGRAYLDAQAFEEAYTELHTCFQRRGDAANYWLPSVHLVPPVVYYLARSQEGMGDAAQARATYERFLALEPDAQEDALAADARRRIGR